MSFRAFVDCHSHVCPSGDDGAPNVATGAWLCREAAKRGTTVLFATPHVWPELPLTPEREARVRAAFEELRPQANLELLLGFELTPHPRLLDEDIRRYELGGSGRVLMEVPFTGRLEILHALAEHAEAAGLAPVIAHPERTEAVTGDRRLAYELAERGWALQVNASSLLGQHGPTSEEIGWELLEQGVAAAVASDGHRPTRPPYLDEAWNRVRARLGDERARPLFDGSALGLTAAEAA